MNYHERHDEKHVRKMNVSRDRVAAKEIDQRLKLDRFPDRKASQDLQNEREDHADVQQTLSGVVITKRMSEAKRNRRRKIAKYFARCGIPISRFKWPDAKPYSEGWLDSADTGGYQFGGH